MGYEIMKKKSTRLLIELYAVNSSSQVNLLAKKKVEI